MKKDHLSDDVATAEKAFSADELEAARAVTAGPIHTKRRDFLAGVGGLTALAMGGVLGAGSARASVAKATATHLGAVPTHSAVSPSFEMAYPVHRGASTMLDDLTKDVFEAHLNSTFYAPATDNADETKGAVALELVQVREGCGHAPQSGHECFSLLFRGPAHLPLAQSTYELQHKTLGKPAIFIVPTGSDENGRYYEAVFNRLRRA